MLIARGAANTGIAIAAVAGLCGCGASLPTHPGATGEESLAIIAERLEAVRTLSSAVDLVFTAADGQSVSLDGAFVAAFPARARIRGWKFGTAAFDLTVSPDGTWLYSPEESEPGGATLTHLPEGVGAALELLWGRGPDERSYFRQARVVSPHATGGSLITTGPALGREDVKCEIERLTLVPRRYWVEHNGEGAELLLDDYQLVQGIAWPHRIRFRGAGGHIVLRLREVELNGELAPGAFTPPVRARRFP